MLRKSNTLSPFQFIFWLSQVMLGDNQKKSPKSDLVSYEWGQWNWQIEINNFIGTDRHFNHPPVCMLYYILPRESLHNIQLQCGWWCSNKVCPRSTNKLRHSSYHKILIRPHERLFLRQRSLNWTEKLRRIVMFFSIALRAELLLDWHGKTLKLPASFVCNLFMFPIFLSLSLAFVARLLKHLLMSIRA